MKNIHFSISSLELLSTDPHDVPLALLLEADPSEEAITKYLSDSHCFVAKFEEQIVAALIINSNAGQESEIYNVSVVPHLQGNGIGTLLLKFALNEIKRISGGKVVLGTGTFGYQLTYYQRLGFRIDTIFKDYFLNNYDDEIWENGIQHKDMLRLYIDLNEIALFDIG
ncbi:GNAT family N-acetyltransferase [Vibrio astriarenae]|uniref:GNAT family N-acetyltransferase n=1 Tax=Vibrio astriarenae TaxID=1481923 RepID=UPI003736175B